MWDLFMKGFGALLEDEGVELKIEVAGDESSRVILWKKLKMKLDTWTILRMKTAQRILMMLPETLLSEMILWKLFMKDLGAEIKEDSLPNVTPEI